MTLFPLMECCELLAIDPKTLRHWLKQATISVHIHPMDGRRKCLTREQVQQLAVLHGRIFPSDQTRLSAPLVPPSRQSPPEEPLHPRLMSEVTHEKIPSAVLPEEGDLSQKLSHLEAQIVAQQQQLALLTQALLLEREMRSERHLSSGDVSAQPMAEPAHSRSRPLHPAEQRARFLVLPPLIEYSTSGTYVVISSQEGEIPLIPDSLEWFEWFRTLSSFRFVGKLGRLSACRGYNRRRPIRTWYAYRTIHQHDYKHYLGVSEHLTVAHLEAMAAKFQSYVDAL